VIAMLLGSIMLYDSPDVTGIRHLVVRDRPHRVGTTGPSCSSR